MDKIKLDLIHLEKSERVYIGKYLSCFEHREGGSKKIDLSTLASMEEEIVTKMKNAGYEDVSKPFLFSFVTYS